MYDHVIVGAGTAGCVLAARLSEDPQRSVLLLEAGPDYPRTADLPASLRNSYVMPREWDWGLDAAAGGGRRVPVPVGKVVGGTSATNGAGAWRPLASDFEAWAARGLPQWGWAHVVDWFNRVENDLDFGDRAWHGDAGPVPVTRWREDELLEPMRGWREAVLAAGHPSCEDMNAPDAVGVGVNPQSRRGHERVSAAGAYLAAARGRPGLELRAGATVDEIALEGDRAVGVTVAGEIVAAREVIVCAGVPLSPAMLLRSGIGPAGALRDAGVTPRVERAGVGSRVMDQPAAVVMAVPRENGAGPDAPFLQLAARLAGFAGFPDDNAFYLCLFAGMPVEEPLRPMVRADRAHWLIVGDLAPTSTGTVTLSRDASGEPICDLGFYSTAADLARMCSGFRSMWELAQHPAFTATIDRFALIGERMVAHDGRLESLVRGRTMSRQPWGGCPMGPADELMAVVDEECRVHGVAGLRTVDASVVPVPLRAGGALTTMMLAERIAARIRGLA